MNTLKSYTWPALLALVSGVSALADVVRDGFIAQLLSYALLALGIAALVAFKTPVLSSAIRRAFPGIGRDFSPAAFAVSCAILGVVVYGFAQLSVRLDDRGGVIAAAFPELSELQAQLGIVDEKVTEIAETTRATAETVAVISDETAFLTEAAGKWIGFERMHVFGRDGQYNFDAVFVNPSSFVFDSVDIIVRNADDQAVTYFEDRNQLIAPGDSRIWRPTMTQRPDRLMVCISGQRRSDGVWTREERVYGNADGPDQEAFLYRVIETDGLELSDAGSRCV